MKVAYVRGKKQNEPDLKFSCFISSLLPKECIKWKTMSIAGARGYHARCVPVENHQGIKSVLVSIGLMLIFLGELRKVVVSRYLLPPTFMIDKFRLLPYFIKVHVEVKMLSCGDHNQKSTNGFHLPRRMDPYVSVAHRLVLDYI